MTTEEIDEPIEFTSEELGTMEERFNGLEAYILDTINDQLVETEELKDLLIRFAKHNIDILDNDKFFDLANKVQFLIDIQTRSLK
jgi:hypothetical protein